MTADQGAQGLAKNCAKQDSSLAVLWTIGVFALNIGPVIVGPILDLVGPKLTVILGKPDCWSLGLSCVTADQGAQGLAKKCAKQDSSLAVLWTMGVFALNIGPVIVGPVLDLVGPKLTVILGELVFYLSALPCWSCLEDPSAVVQRAEQTGI